MAAACHQPPQLDLHRCFSEADVAGCGRLSDRELVTALRLAGLAFSIEACRTLIGMYDQTGGKQVSLEQFRQLHQYVARHKQQFDRLGADERGVLSAQTVYDAISQSGYTITQECFSSLMRRFDRSRDNGLSLDGYVELSVFIHSVKDTFAFYDTQRTGKVMFNFDSFVMAFVHLHAS
eukprot:TRINITY_DN21330_c0_g1_i2.p1 TRINITY_DN21330_c0_g1~~TRINITY_DN21330_c0_g1_i2.p1  ORF type:complete len:191 (+),score=73.11 TRINITY_DN21330_c0_g1_i2:42-575(+)